MKLRLLTTFSIVCMSLSAAFAQMEFTLKGIDYASVAETNSKGFTMITLPAGTNLSELITEVWVDGTEVNASQVTPNPTSTTINYDELKVFTYNNKAYGFRFVEDVWFCGVFFSDCHINQGSGHDGTSQTDMAAIMENILAMRTKSGTPISFSTPGATNLVPKTSIVFCLGDIDQDKGDDGSSGTHTNFLNCTAEIAKTAGIPFIFIAGNHDISPDYWEDGSKGVTSGSTGGSNADDKTISAITTNNTFWNNAGVFDENIQYFTGGSAAWQPNHFTFKFKDVRFYCSNCYWFQKPHNKPGLLSSATYYAPDDIISALNTFVDSHKDEASVWMQHYPWLAGSDCDRWWLDQNGNGNYIPASGSSAYGSCDSGIGQNDATTANNKKKNPLSEIMMKAAGKVDGQVQHFSGHYHLFDNQIYTSSTNSNNKVHDYTVAAPGNSNQSNNAYVVLFKRGEGVKEVIQAQF